MSTSIPLSFATTSSVSGLPAPQRPTFLNVLGDLDLEL